MQRRWQQWLGLLACLIGGPLHACRVPVFRYALERWEADVYRAVVVYRGAEMKRLVEDMVAPMEVAGAVNARVEWIDADALTEAQSWEFDDLDSVGPAPVLRLYFPGSAGIDTPVWEGPLTKDAVALVLDSPVRRQLVTALLEGASTVWLLVQGDDDVQNREVDITLREALAHAEATLKIPDGVVRMEDLLHPASGPAGPPVELDDVLRTPIPLRIGFPVLTVAANDPAEGVLRAMVRKFRPAPVANGGTLVVPVFGRGRMIEGLPGPRVSAPAIDAACRYLCGECSCQVKDESPGADLLLAVNWAQRLGGNLALIEQTLAAHSRIIKPESVTIVGEPQVAVALPSQGRSWRVWVALPAVLAGAVVGWALRARKRR